MFWKDWRSRPRVAQSLRACSLSALRHREPYIGRYNGLPRLVPTKKARRSGPFPNLACILRNLALRELERTAGLGATVLLALDHTAVAGQEATLLEHAAKRGLVMGQRLGDAVAHRTGLAGKTAAGDRCDNVELVDAFSGNDRLLHDHLENRTGEIRRQFPAVDRDLARTGLDPHAGNGVLALAGGVGTALRVDLLYAHGRIGHFGLGRGPEVFEGVDG